MQEAATIIQTGYRAWKALRMRRNEELKKKLVTLTRPVWELVSVDNNLFGGEYVFRQWTYVSADFDKDYVYCNVRYMYRYDILFFYIDYSYPSYMLLPHGEWADYEDIKGKHKLIDVVASLLECEQK
jgi:hypothetical protein